VGEVREPAFRPVFSLLALAGLLLVACWTTTPTPTRPPTAGPTALPTVPPAEGAAWWNDAVFYEVFVRSFYDSDGDGIGDLQGLIERIDYLNDGDPSTNEDLGVTGMWLMPVMESPSYHGYDVVDYRTVERDYGTNEDFRALVAEAHARGIRVIVDLVLNHTSSSHPWFVDARSGPHAEYRDWYLWRAEDPGYVGPWGQRVWHRDDGATYYGIFWEGMPDLNYRNPEVTAAAYEAARFWLEGMGADGFRLDAVHHLIEDGQEQAGTPQTHAWLADFDRFTDEISAEMSAEVLTVGEVWADTRLVAPYVTNDEVDLAFEFSLAGAIVAGVKGGDPAWLGHVLEQVEASYPRHQYATFLANHDQDRVMSQLGGDPDKARLAATILLTLPGVPFIYYGEEIGMAGQKPDELIRTPMQWTADEHAGFTAGQPWEPVNEDYAAVNVATEAADAGSLLNHYRRLIHLRNAHVALRRGDLVPLESSCRRAYGFLRRCSAPGSGRRGEESVLVLLSFSATGQDGCTFSLPGGGLAPGDYAVRELLAGARAAGVTVDEGGGFGEYAPLETLAPLEGYVLLLEPEP
jgi:alpha-amylase